MPLEESAPVLLQRAQRADVLTRKVVGGVREKRPENVAVHLQEPWRSRCDSEPAGLRVVSNVVRGGGSKVEDGRATVADLDDALERFPAEDLASPLPIEFV